MSPLLTWTVWWCGLAVLIIDLDHFKQVNDQYGHRAGDVLLTRLAAILSENVRVSDMVARIGGDEFAILLDNIEPTQVEKKIASLRGLIRTTVIEWDNQKLTLSAAIGYCFIEAEDRVEELMSRADAAMYREKRKAG